MIIALASILAVMAVSALFGYAMHDVIQKSMVNLYDTAEYILDADHDRWEDDVEPVHDCDTCKHEISDPNSGPCFECAVGGKDRWEAY